MGLKVLISKMVLQFYSAEINCSIYIKQGDCTYVSVCVCSQWTPKQYLMKY